MKKVMELLKDNTESVLLLVLVLAVLTVLVKAIGAFSNCS